MTTIKRKTVLTSTIAALLLSAAPSFADDSLEKLSLEDQAAQTVESDIKSERIGLITLGNDKNATRIEFLALPDGYGRQSVAMLEIQADGLGLSDLPGLAGETNPREVFHALAGKGAVEPALLAANYEAPRLGRAGWARDVLAAMPKPDAASRASAGCTWNAFANGFNNLRPDINSTKYWYSAVDGDHDTAEGDFWVHPWANTWWKVYASNARSTIWNNQEQRYTFYNIDKFKSRVRVCEFQSGNAYQDRYIKFSYRSENNAATGTAYTQELGIEDLGWQYTLVWAPTNGLKNYDWVTLVGGATVFPNAHPNDRYFVAAQMK